uniref:Protein E7 n=1 Tax=Human papillomavirus type 6 TaxID=31552 RepID=A0A8F7LDJ5_9PAPI|nr:E7 [Human papillomavirus type 6]
MHGRHVTLKDIVLDLQPPDPVGLHCYEQLVDSSEDEVDEVDGQDSQPLKQHFQIGTCCCGYDSNVRLVVQCTETDIREVQQLLLGTLNIVCPICAPKT